MSDHEHRPAASPGISRDSLAEPNKPILYAVRTFTAKASVVATLDRGVTLSEHPEALHLSLCQSLKLANAKLQEFITELNAGARQARQAK